MQLKELPTSQKPRERLQQFGINNLSTLELLALILKNGTGKQDVFTLSQNILILLEKERYSPTLAQLLKISGIGVAKASQILAALELSQRRKVPITQQHITTAKQIYELFSHQISNQEEFRVIYLNTQLAIITHEVLFKGTLDSVTIHVREIFHQAMKHLAHSIIIMHNHPSGSPQPSTEDIRITKVIEKTGDIVGIPLIDHIIIGKDSYWSWAEQNKK